MYENKSEFPGGRGVQNKKPSMGEYGYLLELHIIMISQLELIVKHKANPNSDARLTVNCCPQHKDSQWGDG